MTTREQAIQWWNGLGDNFFERIQLKQELTDKYFPKRNFGTLTGSEIENIWQKENKITENIYLNRLKEQYKLTQSFKHRKVAFRNHTMCYNAVRAFCLDTQLLDFNTVEAMEYEVNQSFI